MFQARRQASAPRPGRQRKRTGSGQSIEGHAPGRITHFRRILPGHNIGGTAVGLEIDLQTIQAVVLAGSLPRSNGALLTSTVPAGRSTAASPKFVTDCQPLGRTK
jgi:hypothetical protein